MHFIAATLLSVLLAGGAMGSTDGGPAPDAPGIPPGQEDLLLGMLGKGAALPGGCSVTDVGVVYTVIEAHYSCSHGEVVLELTHVSEAIDTDTQTADFAIAVLEGSPPPSLVDVVSLRVQEREDSFQWVMPADPDPVD